MYLYTAFRSKYGTKVYFFVIFDHMSFLSQCLYNLLTLNPVSARLSGYMQKPVSHTNQQKLCAIHKSDSAQFVFIFNSPSVSTDLLRRDTWLCVAGRGLAGRRVNIIPVNAQMMFGSRVQGHLSSAINESGSVSLSGDDCKINEEPFHIQGHIISLRCILAFLFTVELMLWVYAPISQRTCAPILFNHWATVYASR